MSEVDIHISDLFHCIVQGRAIPAIICVDWKNIQLNNCLTHNFRRPSRRPNLVPAHVIKVPTDLLMEFDTKSEEDVPKNKRAYFKLAVGTLYGSAFPFKKTTKGPGMVALNPEGVKFFKRDIEAAWLGNRSNRAWRYSRCWSNWPEAWSDPVRSDDAEKLAASFDRSKTEDCFKGIKLFHDAFDHNTKVRKACADAEAKALAKFV